MKYFTTTFFNLSQETFTCSKSTEICEICSTLTIKTPERAHHSGVFIGNSEHVPRLFPVISFVDFEQVNIFDGVSFEFGKFDSLHLILHVGPKIADRIKVVTLHTICENTGFHWPVFSLIREKTG